MIIVKRPNSGADGRCQQVVTVAYVDNSALQRGDIVHLLAAGEHVNDAVFESGGVSGFTSLDSAPCHQVDSKGSAPTADGKVTFDHPSQLNGLRVGHLPIVKAGQLLLE